jgi:hypothetical protein
MSAQTLPGAGPEPAGTRHDPPPLLPRHHEEPLLPRHHQEPLLPRFHAEEPPGGWPADLHLPDEREDDEC